MCITLINVTLWGSKKKNPLVTVVNYLISSKSCGSQPLPLLLLMTKRWHTLYVKHCLQPPKPKPLATPGLSSPQLQRKGKCFSADTFLLLSRCEREDFSTELKMYFMLGMESRSPVSDKIYIYISYILREVEDLFIEILLLLFFFCFNTLFPFGLFGCWVECRRLLGSWERSGPRDVSVYILYRCICRTSMFKSYLFT